MKATVSQTKELFALRDERTPAQHAAYVKSHGSYAPGEQIRRNYSWKTREGAIENPWEHGWGGQSEKPELNQVSKALSGEGYGSTEGGASNPQMRAYIEQRRHALGKPRALGHDNTASSIEAWPAEARRAAESGPFTARC